MIHCRIQHHPQREYLLPRLLDRLDGPAEVVSDPDPDDRFPSPWRTYRECLAQPPREASHLLILQDDALPCWNLLAACKRILEVKPATPICLFLGGQPARTANLASIAARKGHRFVPVLASSFVPVVAMLWPVEDAEAVLDWASVNRLPGDPRPRSDDAVIGKWARREHREVVATVPSLVQHPDDEASLIGKRARAGAVKWRVAHLWIGDTDPLSIEWAKEG